MQSRYTRLGALDVGGAKLAGRRAVNSTLSDNEAYDVRAFGVLLAARLGMPDRIGDNSFSYSILDQLTGVRFRAYAAQSGPAYGGSPAECFVDYDTDDYQLKPQVLQTLQEFEQWLTATHT